MHPSTLLTTASVAALATAQATTGDIYNGYPVLDVSASSPLDLSTVPANTISRYWLRPAVSQGNIPYFLPVMIARGTNESLTTGRRLSLSASIHGDELNGIPVVHRAFQYLNVSGVVTSGDFNGTVIGVPQVNPQGNFLNARNFATTGNSGFLTNLNRIMPGEADPLEALTDSYAGNIWYGLWGNGSNVDVAVDFHTLSSGSDGPLWAYADYAAPEVQRMAELARLDMVKIDPGEPGSIETTFVEAGIPAITVEVGPAKKWNGDLIDRAEAFLGRLMRELEMLPEEEEEEEEEEGEEDGEVIETYAGTNISSVYVSQSGWVNITVGVLEDVTEGQEVGVLYGWFGDVLETLTAPVAGRVLQHQVDPAVDSGKDVVRIVYNETTEGGEGEGAARRMRMRRGMTEGRGRLF